MKKLIAIALLLIHFYNIGGQLLFHEYLVYQSDKLFNEQISQNRYNIDDLTEIRIPANMPGISDWKTYQNLNGRIQFGNTAYNYIKIRMTRTAIYLVCIPNYATTRLCDKNVINATQIPDIPVPKKGHVPFGKINLATYSHQCVHYKFSIPIFMIQAGIFYKQADILYLTMIGPGRPPDVKTIFS
ncbi:hypothetical protein [Mucilaginibacter gotjawali]|uniref:Uncharacterized protein n=2 Tax=Mucilaginibacter gotjawali TaxID=1550579 RepID=A0A839SJ83_9SPHI|nr:hypothetical protein [Mucilaginibacter gotjawali]MBB3056619.1 hypothetical protein [Mucilaginibacter gotjawali]BAU52678.1 hypothetical protein MgSA37_00840 [Mucilaginibacter gotjawali]